MWSRDELKSRAKGALSKSYWPAFFVCLLSGVIAGGINFSYHFDKLPDRWNSFHFSLPDTNFRIPHIDPRYFIPVLFIFGFLGIVAVVIGLGFGFFVAAPVKVGKNKYFLDNRSGKSELATLFYSFRKGQYLNIVASMAWRTLFTFLWTLLFIIPGIVKAYAYSMVPYILADNPNIGYDRALKLSMDMTRGYKSKIFVLQLSFIGWYLLGMICLFVGVLFVNPYYEASLAEAYAEIRENAFSQGICRPQELNLNDHPPFDGQDTDKGENRH